MERITFKKVTTCEYPSLFGIYKTYFHSIIESSLGWDEMFQQQRFFDSYPQEWFDWVMFSGERLGLICTHLDLNKAHVHLFIIFKKYQNKGVGASVMRCYQHHFSDRVAKISLSSFKNNPKAIQFYHGLGYKIVGEDEHFVDMEHSLLYSGQLGS